MTGQSLRAVRNAGFNRTYTFYMFLTLRNGTAAGIYALRQLQIGRCAELEGAARSAPHCCPLSLLRFMEGQIPHQYWAYLYRLLHLEWAGRPWSDVSE